MKILTTIALSALVFIVAIGAAIFLMFVQAFGFEQAIVVITLGLPI